MRYLGRAREREVENGFLTVDIETGIDTKYKSPLLGETIYISWCVDGKGYGQKWNDLTMWMVNHFLIQEYAGFILYAHNAFGFDMKRIDFQLLIEYGFTCEFLTGRDNSIKSVTVWDGETKWIIRDSYLLIPQKLSVVTKTFAPEFEKIKREKTFDEKAFDPDDKEDQEYAIQDSVGLWYAIERVDNILRDRFGVSIHEGATLPGLAFRAFRLLFKPGDRKAGITGERYPGISFGCAYASRYSYHGGQTLAFQTKPFRDVVSLDANSMYSHVMLNFPLPTGKVQRYAKLPNSPVPDRTLCLAIVSIPTGVFPVLKTKAKSGKVGNYNGTVAGWYWLFELEKQKELGAEFTVIESYAWEESTTCAGRFVALCRDLRMQDYHGALGMIAKLLANALYGKFAQQVGDWNLQLSKEHPGDEALPVYDPVRRMEVPGLWQVKSRPCFSADMTHWASFITAKARMILTEAIQKVGFENIIYCDTDSIFFERKHIERVRDIMGKEYGKFKIEKGKENKGIPFQAVAPKAYFFVEWNNRIKIKNKGIPTSAILKQDGVRRIGGENESIEFISSNNLMQMIKSGKDYGRKAHRKMATIHSTTNGVIFNDKWMPVKCELPSFADIRGDSTLNNKTPYYLKQLYAMMLADYEGKEEKGNVS